MTGFSAEWLALREPADVAARSSDVTSFVSSALSGVERLSIVDLGSGTGSNLRYLSTRLTAPQAWRLVDNDPLLLARARSLTDVEFEPCMRDLSVLDPTIFDDAKLVTASALLDLVSEKWLVDFVRQCRRVGAAILIALNYDGRIHCSPSDPDDEWIRDLVNTHQQSDKGFGAAALGPAAGTRVERMAQDAGYRVRREKSDWVLGSANAELQRQLIAGWAHAASEVAPGEARRIQNWRSARLSAVDRDDSTIIVGHDDVGAVRS
jgi:hypothetical protein